MACINAWAVEKLPKRFFIDSASPNHRIPWLVATLLFLDFKATSVNERGEAVVTAATTTSAASSQRTSTGRFFEAVWLVNGMSATHNSPGEIIVQPLVLRSVAVQEGVMPTNLTAFRRPHADEPPPRSDAVDERRWQREFFTGFHIADDFDGFGFHIVILACGVARNQSH
jgi:hypothetical protein